MTTQRSNENIIRARENQSRDATIRMYALRFKGKHKLNECGIK